MILYRPVGEQELALIRESGYTAFPPRLPEQPIFYPVLNEQYAAEIAGKWNTKDRGLFKSQFYVINHTEAPAILVEIGFISNADERKAITTQKRQSEIAKAISDGIMEYLKNKGKKD